MALEGIMLNEVSRMEKYHDFIRMWHSKEKKGKLSEKIKPNQIKHVDTLSSFSKNPAKSFQPDSSIPHTIHLQ